MFTTFGILPTKTQQKISGRLTNEDTTQDRLDIRSYIDTVRKHGDNALTALHAALTDNPGTYPSPHQPNNITQPNTAGPHEHGGG